MFLDQDSYVGYIIYQDCKLYFIFEDDGTNVYGYELIYGDNIYGLRKNGTYYYFIFDNVKTIRKANVKRFSELSSTITLEEVLNYKEELENKTYIRKERKTPKKQNDKRAGYSKRDIIKCGQTNVFGNNLYIVIERINNKYYVVPITFDRKPEYDDYIYSNAFEFNVYYDNNVIEIDETEIEDILYSSIIGKNDLKSIINVLKTTSSTYKNIFTTKDDKYSFGDVVSLHNCKDKVAYLVSSGDDFYYVDLEKIKFYAKIPLANKSDIQDYYRSLSEEEINELLKNLQIMNDNKMKFVPEEVSILIKK